MGPGPGPGPKSQGPHISHDHLRVKPLPRSKSWVATLTSSFNSFILVRKSDPSSETLNEKGLRAGRGAAQPDTAQLDTARP